MNKDKMLKILLDDLKSKSDKEIINKYKDDGIKVVSYHPGEKGKVSFINNYFDKVNKELDKLSDEDLLKLLEESGLNNCPYGDE